MRGVTGRFGFYTRLKTESEFFFSISDLANTTPSHFRFCVGQNSGSVSDPQTVDRQMFWKIS